MQKQRSPVSIGRLVAKVKALWDLYWKVIVPGALYLDGKIKERRARKRKEKEGEKKPSKKEHPRTTRLRKELERKRRK